MAESTLEKRLRLEVKKHGGLALKFTSPGRRGVPDRLVLKSGGQVVFVEMKDTGKKLEPLQQKRTEELVNLGFKVYRIDSVSDIHHFIQEEFGSAI